MKHFDKIAHLLLLIGLSLGAFTIILATQNGNYRFGAINSNFLIVNLMIFYYLLWSFVYHHTKNNLTKKLFSEYLAVAGIGFAVNFLIFG